MDIEIYCILNLILETVSLEKNGEVPCIVIGWNGCTVLQLRKHDRY
jgi:hypothetical protein